MSGRRAVALILAGLVLLLAVALVLATWDRGPPTRSGHGEPIRVGSPWRG